MSKKLSPAHLLHTTTHPVEREHTEQNMVTAVLHSNQFNRRPAVAGSLTLEEARRSNQTLSMAQVRGEMTLYQIFLMRALVGISPNFRRLANDSIPDLVKRINDCGVSR
jgi:hypothetical protein